MKEKIHFINFIEIKQIEKHGENVTVRNGGCCSILN